MKQLSIAVRSVVQYGWGGVGEAARLLAVRRVSRAVPIGHRQALGNTRAQLTLACSPCTRPLSRLMMLTAMAACQEKNF